MMCRKRQENFVDKYDMFEVVDYALAIQKVHGRSEEVPTQSLCKAQTSGSTGYIRYGGNFLERDDLYGRNNHDHVYMAGDQSAKEDAHHDKGPYCPCYDGLLFLQVFALLRGLGLGLC